MLGLIMKTIFFKSSSTILLGLSLLLSGNNALAAGPGTGQEKPPMPVQVTKAEKVSVPYRKTYPVRLEPFKQVEVHARITANIEKQLYREGQSVQKGDLLYQLDDRRVKANYEMAKAQLENAKIQVSQTKRTYERTKGLGKSISVQEIDDAYSAWKSAQAQLNVAEAELNSRKIELDDSTIEAEISGIIGEKQQDVGDLVGPNTGNTLLNTIRQIDRLYGSFSIADAERENIIDLTSSGLLKTDDEIKVELLDSKGNTIKTGEVDFKDSQIDPQTGSQLIRAVFANADQRLLPGQLFKVAVEQGQWQNVMSVPQDAIIQNGKQAFVYLVAEGKAQMRPVTLAGSYKKQWLVSQGLKGGEQIIINNLIKLRPNSPVQVMSADKKPDAAKPAKPAAK